MAVDASEGQNDSAHGSGQVEIRCLAPSDLSRVVALHGALFRVQSSLRFFERAYYPSFLVSGSTGFGRVAQLEGRFSGYLVGTLDDAAFHRALVRRHPFECALAFARKMVGGRSTDARRLVRGEPRIHYAAVDASARGSGVGRRLLTDGLALVRAAGGLTCSSRIYLDNPVSLRLNQSLGAELVGEGEDSLGRFAICRFDLT